MAGTPHLSPQKTVCKLCVSHWGGACCVNNRHCCCADAVFLPAVFVVFSYRGMMTLGLKILLDAE